MNFILIALLIFIVSISMTMVGKGGGNFYVLILVFAQLSMQNAASTGQFILFTASIAALLVFNKNKTLIWPLAVLIGSLISVSAFLGGYFSHNFEGSTLKIVFSILLFISGIMMLIKVKEKNREQTNLKFGVWKFKFEEEDYFVNLLVAVPIIVLTGFGSGMVGVSGGSFLVPLMVLTCYLPMKYAVGTASSLIAVTALMGFMGHLLQGDVNFYYAVPLSVVTLIGGLIGSKFALKSKPKNLKRLFAYTNFLAAIIMIINALR
ncbi:sulfite exporter TauE/SafE family protein [Helicovermis profundi]|uniref:Probable membrane transporter protein n=1 Tax=Helicovermis profundi TaxID=3065157 RepID=A0AAU9EUH4_9FIRM|nr:sulfite exporter TauE/SafE family protein [Clostridia bacterium S502]